MTLNFGNSQSTVMPKLLDMESSATTVYIRRNVQEMTRSEEGREPETYYVYEECQLTREQYFQYRSKCLESENAELRTQVDEQAVAMMELAARVEEVNAKADESSEGLMEVAGMVANIYAAE